MAFRDMLEGVHRIDDSVSVNHDMMDMSVSLGNVPLVFENIAESPGHRAALNVLERSRLCEMFEVSPGELIDILAWAMDNPSEPQIVGRNEAQVMESGQDSVDLEKLPIPWHFREDGGRYQSASIIIAEYGGVRNVSFHRQLLRDGEHTVARLVPRHLRTLSTMAAENGEDVQIAVVNGADPTVLLAAAMSFTEYVDELTVAAALHEKLHGSPLKVVELSNGVIVPADAEYAMQARITPERDDEGPYVDITGTVDDIRQEHVIEYDAVHHRKDPIFHAIIPTGVEHRTLMGMPRAPTIKTAVSEVVKCTDVHMTDGGCGWLASVIQIVPEEPEDGMRAIQAAFDGHPSMKQVIVVDEDIDIADPMRVEWALMTRWQPDADTVILSNQKGSSLDPSRSDNGMTSKIGMDATLVPGEDKSPYESVL
ncbi:UbiD family decarboxylase [Euryarchaeota archaeon]|nr:UbiD family decarboxylase [Euryarchaeota archaeon]|tara:strand:- start:6792 stop:8063 length:1272 start_codon:yes stop_codon:yes gene_type:complete